MGNCGSSNAKETIIRENGERPTELKRDEAANTGKMDALEVTKLPHISLQFDKGPEMARNSDISPQRPELADLSANSLFSIGSDNPSPQRSPTRIRFQDEPSMSPQSVEQEDTYSNQSSLSLRPLPSPPVIPFTLNHLSKGMLKIEKTRKFAAFSLPNGNSPTPFGTGRNSMLGRQPSRKINYLRNTLKKLSMMDLNADAPETAPSTTGSCTSDHRMSVVSPGNPAHSNAHLLSLESCYDMKLCGKCDNQQLTGVSCLCAHFVCTECFCVRVKDVCTEPELLRRHDFAVFCPIEGCTSPPWNSYHVRKLLDGPTLQLYLDTLVAVCRGATADAAVRNASSSSSSVQNNSNNSGVHSDNSGNGAVAHPHAPTHAHHSHTHNPVSADLKYLIETAEMLREQLRKLNVVPMEYIPLPEIQAELQGIFEKLNNEQPYDEKRMDFLLMCMENNPVYRAEKEELARQWREDMAKFTSECLVTMRGYVPAHISEASLASLQERDGLNLDLAKRLLSKQCLWLVRMRVVDVERIHEVDLMGRFNPIAQGLDIVELAAIFASVPERFIQDPTGRKAQWRLNLENALREMDKMRQTNGLVGAKVRNPCYKKQAVAPFLHRHTLRRTEVVQSGLANSE